LIFCFAAASVLKSKFIQSWIYCSAGLGLCDIPCRRQKMFKILVELICKVWNKAKTYSTYPQALTLRTAKAP